MNNIKRQLITAFSAILCVIMIWIATALKAGDIAELVAPLLVPALMSGYIAYKYGFQVITLPLYAVIVTLLFASGKVYPFYSIDLPWYLPSLLYTIFIGPSSIIVTCTVAGFRAFRNKQKQPNKALQAIGDKSPQPER